LFNFVKKTKDMFNIGDKVFDNKYFPSSEGIVKGIKNSDCPILVSFGGGLFSYTKEGVFGWTDGHVTLFKKENKMKKYTLEQFKKFSAEIEAYERGEEIEYKSNLDNTWHLTDMPCFGLDTEYRVKPKLTRQEITEKWVADNKLKIGDKVRLSNWLQFGEVTDIDPSRIQVRSQGCLVYCRVEELEKIVEEWIPFTFEDRELLRGKWVKGKNSTWEVMINFFNEEKVGIDGGYYTYQDFFDNYEFLDKTPCGKLKL
jgi:hypothetical protein